MYNGKKTGKLPRSQVISRPTTSNYLFKILYINYVHIFCIIQQSLKINQFSK